jgi:pimeloyl-ACP methyl ester carboxylesterase
LICSPGSLDIHPMTKPNRGRPAYPDERVGPDLRGFGASRRPTRGFPEPSAFNADGQARSVLGLIDELGLDRAVIAGCDVGSRVAQAVARGRPAAVRALVLSPPLPGAGHRVLAAEAQREF